ncbi:hypothetical protein XENTR_v10014962 [Xenopus tropicalis]|nr:hypothetical protein XENTR_v10014962 [Xenopus tropicalis]
MDCMLQPALLHSIPSGNGGTAGASFQLPSKLLPHILNIKHQVAPAAKEFILQLLPTTLVLLSSAGVHSQSKQRKIRPQPLLYSVAKTTRGLFCKCILELPFRQQTQC